jgi:hypothetical protein
MHARPLGLATLAALFTALALFAAPAGPPPSTSACLVLGMSVPTAPVVCYLRP